MDQLSAKSSSQKQHRPALPLEAPAKDIQFGTADIRSLLGVPLRHLKLIVAIPVVALVAAFVLGRTLAPQYTSTIEILAVDTKRTSDPGEDKRLSSYEIDQAAIASQIAIIMSQSVVVRAAKDLGLDKDPNFLQSPLSAFVENLGLSELIKNLDLSWTIESDTPEATSQGASPELAKAAYELRERHLKVERKELSYVLEVSATARHPAQAQRIANGIAQAYMTAELDARYEAMRRTTEWLRSRLEDMRAHLLETETAIERLKADNGLSDSGSGSNINIQQITDLNTQLSQARADLLEKQARYDQARKIVESHGDIQGIPEMVSSPVISQLRVQRADLSRREAELRSRFGERHPDVTTARSQVNDINGAINAELARILENMKNSLALAKQREQAVQASLEKLTGKRGDSTAVVKLAELKRVADADRKVYESFLGTFNDVQQRTSIDQTGVRIITPAGLPVSPSFPRKTLMLAIAGTLGLGIAVLLAFLLEYLDAGFRTSSQIETAFGTKPLGMIPKVDVTTPRRAGDIPILQSLVASPLSRLNESLRTLRTAVMLASIEHPPQVVLVTSSMPDEGKSTVSLLYATSTAASNNRVLFIDCDLRRGSATKLLGFGDKAGLGEYLGGKVKSANDIIIKDNRFNLSVIPCGAETRNPAELLGSEPMRQFLLQARKEYDQIIVDGAPILPVVDSVLLAQFVDKILFVIEWNKTPRRGVFEAIKALPLQARLVASIVLNKVDFKRLQSYGYGYGDGYNYGAYYRSMSKYYGKS
jgi:polysaccharide biosynthesis transport protein